MKYQVLTDYLNKHARNNVKYEMMVHSYGDIYTDKLVRIYDTDSYDDVLEFEPDQLSDHLYVDDNTFKLDAKILSIFNSIMSTPRPERLNKKQSLMDDINQNINKLYENHYKQDMTKQEFLKVIKGMI